MQSTLVGVLKMVVVLPARLVKVVDWIDMVNRVSWSFAVLESWRATVVNPLKAGPEVEPDGPLPQPVISRPRATATSAGNDLPLRVRKRRFAMPRKDSMSRPSRGPKLVHPLRVPS